MSQRLDGVREANRCLWVALTPFILQKSRMRKRARTDLCGGRSAMIVPTATSWRDVPSPDAGRIVGSNLRPGHLQGGSSANALQERVCKLR